MDFPYQLRVPGPTPIPSRVQEAMAAPMINHRGPEFKQLLSDIEQGLKWGFQTQNDLLLFPASGTGGLESAIQNLISPGERVLAVTIGAFGDRFADIAASYGADVVRLSIPWGESADPEDIDETLAHEPEIKTVLITHNETSTGVLNPLQQLAGVVKRHGRLLVVDGVSSIGSIELPVDDWGVDVAITASQKGWMVPPGLTMLSISPAAWDRQAQAKSPRYYFDWTKARQMQAEGATFTTPVISILLGLREALRMMKAEELPAIFARHLRMAAAFRAAASAIGLRLLAAPEFASPTVTAVQLPEKLTGDRAKALFKTWRERYRLVLAGGQGHLSGKIFRVGHLGAIEESDVIATVTAMEAGLKDEGYEFRGGAGLDAARQALEARPGALIS